MDIWMILAILSGVGAVLCVMIPSNKNESLNGYLLACLVVLMMSSITISALNHNDPEGAITINDALVLFLPVLKWTGIVGASVLVLIASYKILDSILIMIQNKMYQKQSKKEAVLDKEPV